MPGLPARLLYISRRTEHRWYVWSNYRLGSTESLSGQLRIAPTGNPSVIGAHVICDVYVCRSSTDSNYLGIDSSIQYCTYSSASGLSRLTHHTSVIGVSRTCLRSWKTLLVQWQRIRFAWPKTSHCDNFASHLRVCRLFISRFDLQGPRQNHLQRTHGSVLRVLLTVVSLLVSIDAASTYRHLATFTASNAETVPHTLAPAERTITVRRFLRTDKKDEGDDDVADSEERALPNEILRAGNHAENVISTGIKESSILKWLDKISLKLKYKYWLLTGKTPADAKKLLGAHYVSNFESHPNYQTWLGYKRAYNKKHNTVE